MMDRMPVALPFCRLVLGDGPAADAAAAAVAEGLSRDEALAAAWHACARELARRAAEFAWDDVVDDEAAPIVRLAALPAAERGALAARALGASPESVGRVLGVEAPEAAELLTRAHAGIGGGGSEEAPLVALREAVGVPAGGAADGGRPRPPRRMRRPALPALPRRPAALPPRVVQGIVALVVLLAAGVAGYEAVSALEGHGASGGSQVVTATPVGPLPPGVK